MGRWIFTGDIPCLVREIRSGPRFVLLHLTVMTPLTESSRDPLPTPLSNCQPFCPVLVLAAMAKASYFHISQAPSDLGAVGHIHRLPICAA
jgi:hypothetical protein